jgi:hypothetical protein
MSARQEKITFAEMRDARRARDLGLITQITTVATRSPSWRSDIEPRFICAACGKRGADARPDFH